MEAMTMLRTAVVIFAIAAGGGLLMASIRFLGKRNPPAWLAMLHGLPGGRGIRSLSMPANAPGPI